MTLYRNIDGKEVAIKLSDNELIGAHKAWQRMMDEGEVRMVYDLRKEDGELPLGLTEELFAKIFEETVDEYQRTMRFNHDDAFISAADEAIEIATRHSLEEAIK